jgi:hypothetical protein
MLTSPDFKELLSILAKHEVRYLVVGGYAVMKYTEPPFTKDLDLWIATDEKNSEAVFAALKEFGAPPQRPDSGRFPGRRLFLPNGEPSLASGYHDVPSRSDI